MTDKQASRNYEIFSSGLIASLALLLILSIPMPRILGIGPIILFLLAAATWHFYVKKPFIWDHISFIWMGLITGLCGISCIWSVEPEFSIERTIKIALIGFSGFGLLSIIQMIKQNNHSWVIPVSMGVSSFILCYDYLFDFPIYRFFHAIPADEEFYKPHMNRGTVIISLFLLPMLATILYGQYPRLKKYLFSAAILALALISIALTKSQTAQLAVLIGVVFLIGFPYRSKFSWIGLWLIISIGALATPWLVDWGFKKFASDSMNNPLTFEASIPQRLEIWSFIGNKIQENPYYGFGVEATRHTEFDVNELYYVSSNSILHPHNVFLQIWIEFGILGILLALSFLGWVLYRLYKKSINQQRIGLAVTMSCLSVALTGYGFWQSWLLGLFILAALFYQLASDRIDKQTVK